MSKSHLRIPFLFLSLRQTDIGESVSSVGTALTRSIVEEEEITKFIALHLTT